ncbi:LytR/AlgR family response regulator transcription factor [Enterococcus sp. OL5]|uniref:LytR/AlgR family response regulator transcription factor n=1 Tax=Enterococcus sp. OL5 TaxID=2590214 RepID=UPI001125E42E|nr:LytTR family transcriptional regulator DNA-binding domain-containing protein [Enterococcus sp. OL5]TPR55141.1 response regulator [Enterococcus sp. OL5]
MSVVFCISIIEDELNQAKLIADALHKIDFSTNEFSLQVNISQNYIQMYENNSLNIKKNDIFLIDIHLNTYFSGIEFAKHIIAIEPEVFILYYTSDPGKSITAINEQTHPTAYILKDFDQKNLMKQLRDTLEKIGNQLESNVNQKNVIKFLYHGEFLFINPQKILYIQTVAGIQKKTILHTDSGEYMLNYRLIDIKPLLPDNQFKKNFKSVILNLTRIHKINRLEGIITFDDNSEIYVGTKVIDKLKKESKMR